MSGMQTKNGKAFEYACLKSLQALLPAAQGAQIKETAQLETARRSFHTAPASLRDKLEKAASAAARVIARLEPQIEFPGSSAPLCLSLQSDARGQGGDVRDVICSRAQNEWEIGFSCKHNHHAVKHSRLSAKIDFGAAWFGLPCSREYFGAIAPLFDELQAIRESSNAAALWSSVERKNERFYMPALRAFMDELARLDAANPGAVPERLIRYLVGKNDFYKIIADDSRRTTRIEAVNISGTLNRPAGGRHSIANVARLKLPTQFHDVSFKANSETTIALVCDEGWSVSMRIHSASSRVEPSLKFDVNLISLPNTIHAQVEPW